MSRKFMKLCSGLLMLFFVLIMGKQSFGQAITTYTPTTGTAGTLDPMTSSTQLVAASTDDGQSSLTNIGFTFNFAGTNYTQFSANSNGALCLGAAVGTGYTNSSANIVAPAILPYWGDLHTGVGGKVHYVLSGTSPNRILKIEWYVTVPRSTTGNANTKFQCWLYETSNVITFIYGTVASNSGTYSIGVATSTTVYSSVATATNTASTSTFTTSQTSAITAGRTFTWTPPPPCVAPTAQPTSLSLSSITGSSLSGSFTAASGSPSGYLVVRSTSSSLSSGPVDATSYSAAGSLGGGTVVQSSSATTFSETGLTANTQYYYFIYSYNNTSCSGGPKYYTTSPLSANTTTCLATPSAPTGGSATTSGFTASWTAVTGATGYSLEVSSNSGFTSPITGSPFSTTSTSQAITGLTSGNTYYFRVTATGGVCNSAVSASSTGQTLVCAAPSSLAATASLTSSTLNTISGSFTAASTAPTGYVVVRTTTNTQPTPATGTPYTAGANAIGYIEYSGASASSWTSTSLTPGTNYYYWVFSYNSTSCSGGPVYSASATALSASTSSCPTYASTISINGSTAVPGTSYPTLTAAIAELKICGISQPMILELASGYTPSSETYPITLSSITGASATNTITIREASGVTGKIITTTNATATFDINAGNYWIIDGRSGGTGSADLSVGNTGAAPAFRFINEGSNNIVKYVKVTSTVTSLTSGLILFSSTTGSNGNDNNTIDNCDLNGGGTAANIIYASGTTTTTATNNSGITISNNNIRDQFIGSSATSGILVAGGNTDWTISGNSFYQTATRTYTGGSIHTSIYINNSSSGNNFSITNNNIGGTAASLGGTALTMAGSFANRYVPIYMTVGTTTASSIQGNTISKINLSSTSGATTTPGVFSGIYVSAGTINIGNITGNTIGNSTGIGSIVVSSSTTGGISCGIASDAITTVNISNNNIGSLTISGSSTSVSHSFIAINTAGTAGNYTINGNTIGSTNTTNSINTNTATTSNGQQLLGIANSATGTISINNNIVANLNNANNTTSTSGFSPLTKGIVSSAGTTTISGNTIKNLFSATPYITAASIIGIQSSTSTAGSVVTNNTISGLINTNSAVTTVCGISYAGPTTGTNIVSRNLVYGLSNSSTTGSQSTGSQGILVTAGASTIQNNMIRLGIDTAGNSLTSTNGCVGIYDSVGTNNYYHNSVYIGGSGVSTGTINTFAFRSAVTTNTRNFQNNIFFNARSNSTTGGKHYAVMVAGTAANPAGLNINNNIYFVSGPVLGLYNGVDRADLATWKTAVGQDAASFSSNPQFISATTATPNLHINTSVASVAESAGTSIAAVTDDFDGETRSGLTPTDIGADAFNGLAAVPVITVSSVVPAASTQCTKSNRVVNLTVTTPSGTISSVTLNYNHNGTAQTSVTMTNTSGDIWTGTMLAPATANATVTWSATATNSSGFTTTYTGTSYADEPNTGLGLLTSASATPSTVCAGSNTSLNILVQKNGSIVTGTGTSLTSSTSYPTAFENYEYQTWQQFLIKASELQALGLSAGNITSLSFNVGALPSPNTALSDYNIKIAPTNSTALASFTTTGLVNVFGPASVTAATGLNKISFTTPYNWDGTSNLIIDLRQTGHYGSANATTYYTTTSYNSVLYAYTSSSNTGFWTSSPLPTTSTSRPNITLEGKLAMSPSAYSWSDGTNVVGNTNPLSTTVSANTTFTGTATYNNCPLTASVSVTSTPLPTAPAATNSTQCGVKVPTCSVASTSAAASPVFRWYKQSSGGTAIAGESGTSLTSLSNTVSKDTTFYVSEFSNGCEGPRSAVSVTYTVPPTITLSLTGSFDTCVNGIKQISITSSISDYDTLRWSGGTLYSDNTASTLLSGTSFNTVYYKRATATSAADVINLSASSSVTGCLTSTSSGSINVFEYPNITTASASPSTVCSGNTVTLLAKISNETSIGSDNAGTKITGAGSPYRSGANLNNQIRNQYLVLASELTAAGLVAGPISSLSFTFNAAPTGSISNLTFKLANVSDNALTATYLTPSFTTVLSINGSYSPVNGLNTHTFSTPFNWDGTSNIVVDMCGTISSSGTNGTIATTTTTVVTTVYSSSTTACSSTSGTTGTNRPFIKLGTSAWNWSTNLSGNAITSTTAASANHVPVNLTSSPVTDVYSVRAVSNRGGCTSTLATNAITVNPTPVAPTAQPTSLVFTPYKDSVLINFTASVGGAEGYLVVRYTTPQVSPTAPTDNSSYTLGATFGTGGKVVGFGNPRFKDTVSTITSATTYYYYVYPYNGNTFCGTIKYFTDNPLNGSATTCISLPVSSAATSITTTGFTANWAAVTGADGYTLDVSTSSTFTNFVSGYQGLVVSGGTTTNFAVTGLSQYTTYYYRVSATSTTLCAAPGYSGTQTVLTPYAVPYLQTFSGTTWPGWTTTEGATGATYHWAIGTQDSTNGVKGPSSTGGTKFAFLNVYNASTTYNPYYFNSPAVAIVAGTQLSYQYYIGANGTATAPLVVEISTNGGTTWTALFTHASPYSSTNAISNWATKTIDLSGYAGQNALIRFKGTSNYGSTAPLNMAVDEVYFQAPCATPSAPSAISFSVTGPGTTTINVTPTSTADKYMLVRYPAGSTPVSPVNLSSYTVGQAMGDGIITNISSSPSSIKVLGLSPNTNYDFYVYPYNSVNCLSGPVYGSAVMGSVTTAACPTFNSTITIGSTASDYSSLSDAVLILNGCPVSQPTVVELQADYTSANETYPIVINNNSGASATNTITIRPSAGIGALTLNGTTTSPLIDLSGAKYYTIDGRAGGTGTSIGLNFVNSGNGSALRFINDAQNNVVQYTQLKSSNTSQTNGVVSISTAAGTALSNGNNNNSILNNDIDGNGVSPIAIYALGSATPADNKSLTLSGNNIHDYYSDATGITRNAGIQISANNGYSAGSGWTINGNSFYQSVTRNFAVNTAFNAINADGGSSILNITNNFVGGTSASASGSPLTLTGAAAYTFSGIRIFPSSSETSTVSGNTIKNINATTTYTSSTLMNGIGVNSGQATITNNVIGSTSTSGSITVSTGAAGGFTGINALAGSSTTGTTLAISVNTIAGIAFTGANTSNFTGINIASGTLMSGISSVNNNSISSVTNTTGGSLTGIRQLNSGTFTINGNNISGFTSTTSGTASQLIGIYASGGINTIGALGAGNTINALSSNSANVGTTTSASIIGIYNTSTSGIQNIGYNTISGLQNTSSAVSVTSGLYFSGSTSFTNNINNNFVYGNTSTGASAVVQGFEIAAGLNTISNNLIALGNGNAVTNVIYGMNETAGTNSIYYNSIYIGGSSVGTTANSTYAFRSTSTSTRTIKNNIFSNARSNATTGGKHYAITVAGTSTSPSGLTINNNDYYANGTGGVLGYFNSADRTTIALWKTATGLDANSYFYNPNFNAPTASTPDLTINSSLASVLEGSATSIGGITRDYAGNTRNGSTPDIGAYEFSGTSVIPVVNSASSDPSNCSAVGHAVTANITALGAALTSVQINYSYNGTAQTPITMTLSATNAGTFSYIGSIPAASPVNATVAWSVVANDGTFTATKSGTSYTDAPNFGVIVTATSSASTVCAGSTATLTATPKLSYTPLSQGFESGTFPPTGWTNINAGSGNSWITSTASYSGSSAMQYSYNSSNAANAWMISPAQSMKAGTTYTISFWYKVAWASYPEKLKVTVGNAATTASQTTTLWNNNNGSNLINETYSKATITYTPTSNGNYYFGWNCYSDLNMDYLYIDDISIADNSGAVLGTTSAYSWSNGSSVIGTTASLPVTVNATTTYTATATINNCPVSGSVTVNATALPNAPTANATTQCGLAVPVVSAITGGQNGTFRWYSAQTGGTLLATGQTPTLSAISTTTTYYLSEDSGPGTCESLRTPVTVTVTQPDAIDAVTDLNAICLNGTVNLSVSNIASSPTNNYTFTWTAIPASGSGIASSVTGNTTAVIPSAAGTYKYVATGIDGICKVVDTVVVLVNPLPTTPTITASATTICAGTSINLSATSNGTYTWSWTPGPLTGATQTVTPMVNTTYTATATVAATGCSKSNSVSITVNSTPPPSTYNQSQCGYGVPNCYALGGLPGTYRWYLTPTGGTALAGETNNKLSLYTIDTTTTFYVSIYNGICESVRNPVTETVTQPDKIAASASAVNICTSESIVLSVTQNGTTKNYSYVWTATPASGSGIDTSVSGNGLTITPTSAGTYVYKVIGTDGTDPQTNCVALSTVSVVVKQSPVVGTATATPAAFCVGGSTTLTVNPVTVSGPQTVPTGYCSAANSASSSTACISSVTFNTLSNSSSCNTISPYYTDVPVSTSTTTVAAGQTYTFSVSTVADITYPTAITSVWFDWNRNGVFEASEWYQPYTSATTGSISVTVPANASVGLTKMRVRSRGYNNANGSGDACTSFGSGEAEDYTINVIGSSFAGTNFTYTWTPGTSLTGTTITTTPSVTTTYNVNVSNPANGCSTNKTVLVTVNQLPPAPTVTGNEQCGSGVPNVTATSYSGLTNPIFKWYLVASGGTAVQIDTSTTNSSTYHKPIFATTTFYVSEISAFGCEGPRNSVTINVNPPDPILISMSSHKVCLGETATISSSYTPDANYFQSFNLVATPSIGSGITSTIALTIDGTGFGTTSYSFTPTVAGTYILSLSGNDPDKGCNSTAFDTIIVNGLPVIDSVKANASAICAGGSVNLNAYSSISTILPAPTTLPTGYCAGGGGSNYADEQIFAVSFGSMINIQTEQCLSNYTDYSGTITAQTISRGATYPLSVTVDECDGATRYKSGVSVFIDYNRDGDFEDAGEKIYTTSALTKTPYTKSGSITIPTTASPGKTKMRVVAIEDVISPSACETYSYGETEDYAVFITGDVGQTLTVNPNFTYTWNPGAVNTAAATVSPANTTSYTCTVYNPATGCSAVSSPINITVNSNPTPVATNSTQCGPGVPTCSVASSSGGTLKWYSAATGGTLLQTGGTIYTSSISTTTSFYVAETSSFGCTGPRVQVTATVAQPDPIVASSNGPICLNGTLNLTATVSTNTNNNNYALTWSSTTGSGITGILNGTTATYGTPATTSVIPTAAGTYTFTVNGIDASGVNTCITSASVSVVVNSLPVIDGVQASSTTLCSGSSTTLNAYSSYTGAGPQTAPTGYCSAANSATSSTVCISSVSFNTLNNSSSCNTTSPFYTDVPVTTATTTVTAGQTYTLSVSTIADAIYPTAITSVWFDWNRNGVFEASEWYQPYTSAITGTVSVTVPANASAGLTKMRVRSRGAGYSNGSGDACTNFVSGEAEDYVINVMGVQLQNPNYTYNWIPGNLSGYTVSVTPTVNTTYAVQVTNPTTGCTSTSGNIDITIAPVTATATATPSSPICLGASAVLSASATGKGPFTYSWSNGVATFSSTSSVVVTPTVTTTYTVTVKDACNNATTSSVTVVVNSLPTATINEASPINICVPNTQVLTASSNTADATFQWMLNGVTISGATNASYTAATSGTYTVKAIATTGCVGAASAGVIVNVNPLPSAGITNNTGSTTLTCARTSISLTATGGATYSWNNSLGNSAVVSVTSPGTYTATVTSSLGCSSVASLSINQNLTTSSSSSSYTACNSYTWKGVTYTSSGSYTYHTTNTIGCDSSVILVLTINASTSSVINASVCSNTLPYLWNGTSYNLAGTYSKTFSNIVGCDSIATLVLQVKSPSSSVKDVSICASELPYSWNNTQYTASGTYTYLMEGANANGCDSAAILNLKVKQPSASSQSASACISYTWNGVTYSTSGVKTFTTTNAVGCDSVATLNLTITPQPSEPAHACYETATFNNATCSWEITGTQPAQPTLACYESATFNTTTCNWDVTGTQPVAPTGLACYQTATFNGDSCKWIVTGTQPAAPTGLACYQTATFNTDSCKWIVTGTQPAAPTGLACYQTAAFNTDSCKWIVTGTQPAAPTGLACYQTAAFNTDSCKWIVTGTQPAAPTGLACYQTATFNADSCKWIVTGTQPAAPTGLACYQTATFNADSCKWIVTGTQPATPNAGTNSALQICSGSSITAAQLYTALGGSPEAGGVWTPAFAGAGVYTYTVTGEAPCNYTSSATVTVSEITCPTFATLNVKAFIQGFYRGNGTMAATLYDLDSSTDATATDTITVSLWNASSSANAAYTQKVILHTDGTATAQFPGATLGNSYYIAISHRNSVETWSAEPVAIASTTNYDFSSGLSQAYGDGTNEAMKNMGNGVYAIYSGDVNQDGGIDLNDLTPTQNDASNFEFGYNATDCTGDGGSDLNDLIIIQNNATLFLFKATPY